VLNYVEPQKHLDFPELVQRLLENGRLVMSYPFNGYWLDIGNHSDYTKAIEEFESMKFSLNITY
jgi:NDP-sugar pyrophosphorylase family protein